MLLINAFKSSGSSGSNPIRTYKYADFVFVRLLLLLLLLLLGARGVVHIMEAVLYKPEGRGFDSR